jgi:hypothetical protein
MELRFHEDPETGELHIDGHDVRRDEVEAVLQRPIENLPGRRNSRILIGRTRAGRILKVICVPDVQGEGIFVITAFDLRGKALRAHNRRLKKRGRR